MFLACAIGIGGELHVYTSSFGTIAMLDLVSYFAAPIILITQWKNMGKHTRIALVFCFLWSFAAAVSNFVYGNNVKYWFKCVALASSSWSIFAVAYILCRRCSRAYLWYLVGAGIGGWIGLYYFRNGAIEVYATHGDIGGMGYGTEFLMEKQIYPSVAKGILLGVILPFFVLWKKMPAFFVFIGMLYTGFWLLFNGGSRSGFGCWTVAATAGILVLYCRRVIAKMIRNPVLMVVIAAIGIFATFTGYRYLASSGQMGDVEADKYEAEFGKGGRGAIMGRASFGYAIECAKESYGIGLGGHLRCHSVMANALACEGLVGFLFWTYFYLQVLWWCMHRMPYAHKFSAFIMLMFLIACWAVFGSPFGTRHKFFVALAFISLCRDNVQYGINEIFDFDMLNFEDRRKRRLL